MGKTSKTQSELVKFLHRYNLQSKKDIRKIDLKSVLFSSNEIDSMLANLKIRIRTASNVPDVIKVNVLKMHLLKKFKHIKSEMLGSSDQTIILYRSSKTAFWSVAQNEFEAFVHDIRTRDGNPIFSCNYLLANLKNNNHEESLENILTSKPFANTRLFLNLYYANFNKTSSLSFVEFVKRLDTISMEAYKQVLELVETNRYKVILNQKPLQRQKHFCYVQI